ncbi:hypothetical protein GH733_014055, partial [Mirounga leonina]
MSYDVSKKELRDSSCHVGQLPGFFPKDVRRIRDVLVQETKKSTFIQNQTGYPAVPWLWEQSQSQPCVFREKVKGQANAEEPESPCCSLQKQHYSPNCHLTPTSKFQTGSLLTGKDTDENLKKRQKWSTVVKFLIAVTLLLSGVAMIVAGEQRAMPMPVVGQKAKEEGQQPGAAESQLESQPKKESWTRCSQLIKPKESCRDHYHPRDILLKSSSLLHTWNEGYHMVFSLSLTNIGRSLRIHSYLQQGQDNQ